MLKMAGQEGVEPPTSGFGDRRSTNWSYWPAQHGDRLYYIWRIFQYSLGIFFIFFLPAAMVKMLGVRGFFFSFRGLFALLGCLERRYVFGMIKG